MTHLDEPTLTAYLKGTLPQPREAEVEAHLTTCPDCSRLVDNWQILYKDIGRLTPEHDASRAGPAPPAEAHDHRQQVLLPYETTGETGTQRRPRWSGWLWAVGGLTAVLVIGSVIALKMGVGRDQGRNANKVLDVLEGMRPDPVAPNRLEPDTMAVAPDTSVPAADSVVPAAGSQRSLLSSSSQRRPDSTLLLRDSLPQSPAATLPGFERVSHVDATGRYGGALRWVVGLPIDHYEVGPGGSVPGSSPATEVIRIVGRAESGLVFIDQQRDPGIAGGVALGVGDTLVTTADNGVTVAMWRPTAVERIVLAAVLPREDLMALVRRVR